MTLDEFKEIMLRIETETKNISKRHMQNVQINEIQEKEEVILRETANKKAEILFPVLENMINEKINRALETRVSPRLGVLESVVNTIRSILGV